MILWSLVFTFTTMTASLIRILWACFTQRCIFMNVDIINTTVILTVLFTTTFDFTGRFNIGLDVIVTSAIVIMIMWRGQLLSAWPASLWWDRRLTLLLLECHASAACLCKMIAFTTFITNETPGSTWMITWTCIAQTPTACLTCWWPVWRPGSVVSVGVDVGGSMPADIATRYYAVGVVETGHCVDYHGCQMGLQCGWLSCCALTFTTVEKWIRWQVG